MKEFYTIEEVIEFARALLATHPTDEQMDKIFREDGFCYRSFSNNSIDFIYFGRRIRVKVRHTRTGTKLVESRY